MWAQHEDQHRRMATTSLPHNPGAPAAATVVNSQPQRGGPPQVFVHKACCAATMIPPEYVRNYLNDPFVFPDAWPCSGCQKPIPTSELYWEGSQTSLLEYGRQLRIQYIQEKGLNPADFEWGPSGPMRRAVARPANVGGALATFALIGTVVVVGGLMLGVGIYVFASVMPDNSASNNAMPAPNSPPPVVTSNFNNPPMPSAPPMPSSMPFRPSPSTSPPSFSTAPGSPWGPGGNPHDAARRQIDEARRQHEEMMRQHDERMQQMQRDMQRRQDEMRSRFGP